MKKIKTLLYCHVLSPSLVPKPSRSHANIIREIFYMHQKAGRSGRFYAVMMMSPGRGLARPLDFLDTERYLPTHTILARGEVSKIGVHHARLDRLKI